MSDCKLSRQELRARALGVSWLLLDVDGVLTDGRLYYGLEGEELKAFHVRDGLGLRLAQKAGLSVGLLSGRTSKAVERRARELDLEIVGLGSGDKGVSLTEFLAELGLEHSQVAYAGDDLPDLPVMRRVALSFAPADAAAEVRAVADVVAERAGGNGAVREIVELLLRARDQWQTVLEE